jgi:prepilin-type N-terminal cleavage/methylation domain-containing protein
MKILCNKTGRQGFSIVEVLVAISVITIGITGAMNLINFTISSVTMSKSQTIAVNLTQEGMEVIRSIRDSNWLENVVWDSGLGAGDYQVQYDNNSLLLLSGNPVLKIDSNGFYQYDSGTDTRFKRKMTISDVSANEIKVVSEVTWDERGKSYNTSVETRLYDWR